MHVTRTAGAFLIKGDKVLLGLRSKQKSLAPGTWDISGGHCEDGETIEQALVRELKEEIGVTPVNFRHIASIGESTRLACDR